MARLKLAAPWVEYYHQLEAFFAGDRSVQIILDEENFEVKLYVTSSRKATALDALLPKTIEFGNVTLKVTVVPANEFYDFGCEKSKAGLLHIVLQDNDAYSYEKTIEGVFTNNITYFVFENEVVQYFNDSLSDIHGLCSTLYENLARVIFGETEGVFFCTDLPEH